MTTPIEIKIEAKSELDALRRSQEELQHLADNAKAGGLSAAELEKQLNEVNRELGQRTISAYSKALEELIAKERAAGNATDELERKLHALSAMSPDTVFSKGGAEIKALLDAVPGVGALTRSLNGNTLAVGATLAGVTALAAAYTSLVTRGIEFNTRIGDAQIAIGNVLRQFQGLDQQAAKAEAAKAMQKIVELEPQTAATLDGMVQGFMATVAASQSAGVSVEQNIDLVSRFANALANANIPADQLAQEMRSILSGNIGADSALARTLQITNAQVESAREQGRLYEFLIDKLGTLGEAGDSAAVRMSSLQSAMDKLSGQVAKPIFDGWLEGLDKIKRAVDNNGELANFATGISTVLAEAARMALTVGSVATGLNFGAAVDEANELGKALAAQRNTLRDQIAAATDLGSKAAIRSRLEFELSDAQSRLTTASGQQKEMLGNQVFILSQMLGSFDKAAGKVREVTQEESAHTTELKDQVQLTEKQLWNIQAIKDKLAERDLANLSPADQVSKTRGDVGAAKANVRSALADQGISGADLPAMDAAASAFAAAADKLDGAEKAAIYDQISRLINLEDAAKRAADAAEREAKARERSAEAAQKQAQAQSSAPPKPGSIEDLTQKRDAAQVLADRNIGSPAAVEAYNREIDELKQKLAEQANTNSETLGKISEAADETAGGLRQASEAAAQHAESLKGVFSGVSDQIKSLGDTVSEGFQAMTTALSGVESRLQGQINDIKGQLKPK